VNPTRGSHFALSIGVQLSQVPGFASPIGGADHFAQPRNGVVALQRQREAGPDLM